MRITGNLGLREAMKAIEAEIMRREMMSMEWILDDCISRQLSQYISVGSIFISWRSSTVLARVSIFVARVPSLARKRAIILLRDFCDTEDYLDKKNPDVPDLQIHFLQIKVLLQPFFIITFVCKVTNHFKCNILPSIFT